MKIEHGLVVGQVLQRNAKGVAAATVVGKCKGNGIVEVSVNKGSRTLSGFGWKQVGVAHAGKFEATLDGVPCGGPYQVALRVVDGEHIADSITVEEIFVGDVWILAGQSNMEGVGNMSAALKPHPMVRAFYMRDEWGVAAGKIHYLAEAVDPVHNGYGAGPARPRKVVLEKGRAAAIKGIGPGHAFGLDMFKRTGVPQGLIACAHGGTSMQQWSPELKGQGGASLYGAMLRRYEKLGQPVAGVLWYQGESDANTEVAARYTDRMMALVGATRCDLGLPQLPWFIVQIGRHAAAADARPWNSIQEQQRRLPERIARLDVVPAVDLDLDDGIHVSGADQHRLGRRLARVADRLLHKAPKVKATIQLDKIELVSTPGYSRGDSCSAVRVQYRNVTGRLQSPGLASGFSLHDQAGRDTKLIFRTTLERDAVLLHTTESRMLLELLSVCYGAGRMPYCNITDSVDMGLPVMIQVPVSRDHIAQITQWETAYLGDASSVRTLSHAAAVAAKGWKKAPLRAQFGVLPQPTTADCRGVFVMRTELVAAVALTAQLQFGANIPFKMWLNGKRVLADLSCGIPLHPDQYEVPLKLKAGQNILAVGIELERAAPHFGLCARIGTPDGKAEPRVSVK